MIALCLGSFILQRSWNSTGSLSYQDLAHVFEEEMEDAESTITRTLEEAGGYPWCIDCYMNTHAEMFRCDGNCERFLLMEDIPDIACDVRLCRGCCDLHKCPDCGEERHAKCTKCPPSTRCNACRMYFCSVSSCHRAYKTCELCREVFCPLCIDKLLTSCRECGVYYCKRHLDEQDNKTQCAGCFAYMCADCIIDCIDIDSIGLCRVCMRKRPWSIETN